MMFQRCDVFVFSVERMERKKKKVGKGRKETHFLPTRERNDQTEEERYTCKNVFT